MKILAAMFTRRWLLATILVAAGVALCARLGIWQLDRLEQRRAFNARVQAQVEQPALQLKGEALAADLHNQEYREVEASGRYDFANQVAIRNQSWGNEPGVHLLTPLIVEGTQTAVLVDRGWIPLQDFESGEWSQFDEPGLVEVKGILRRSQSKADLGGRSDLVPAPGEAPLKAWIFVNIDGISKQLPYPVLPAYLQQAPDESWTSLPYRDQPKLELTEGPHQSYALQWFSFAALLGIGYPFFIRKQHKRGQGAPEQSNVNETAKVGTPHHA